MKKFFLISDGSGHRLTGQEQAVWVSNYCPQLKVK